MLSGKISGRVRQRALLGPGVRLAVTKVALWATQRPTEVRMSTGAVSLLEALEGVWRGTSEAHRAEPHLKSG